MDSFNALNAFVQAAELRSFTTAGQKLGVSSSAISKAIARLEDRVGVRLFHRSTRIITLTPEGALFLERCRRIFCELEAAELELRQTQEKPSGKLRLSLPLVGMLMMPSITAFMQAWPDIELDLDFTDRLVDVIEEGFDAVVRTGKMTDSRLMSRKLGTFRYHLVGSPDYFEKYGMPETIADLEAHRGLRHIFPSTGKIEEWPLLCDLTTLRPDIPTAATANAIEPLIHLAEQGIGLACLPEFAIRSQLKKGRLITTLNEAVTHSNQFYILWPSSRHLSPKLRIFVDFFASNLVLSPK
ncbi:LysR family transcriptional regulator [Brucellaceae bacterium C25G]